MERAAFDQELFLKGWKKVSEDEYEQYVAGYVPFFLHYDEKVNGWRLKRWGLGMSITIFEELNEETVVSIFRLCSQYAKQDDF